MTQDEIIEMARQAGFFIIANSPDLFPKLVAFANLVAAKEREALAQEPDDIASILACRDMLDAQPVPEADRVIWPERTEQEPVQFKCTVIDDVHPNGIPLEQWTPPPQRTEQLKACVYCGQLVAKEKT